MPAVQDITVLTTSTSIVDGAEAGKMPMFLFNASNEDITLTFQGSSATKTLLPGEQFQVWPKMVITATSASGGALLKILRAVRSVPGPNISPAHDSDVGGDLVWQLNPPHVYTLPQQEVAADQGNGVTEYYVAFLGHRDLTVQIQDTPGSGTNTYKIYASAEAGDEDADSATYVDVGTELFGAASWTADAILPSKRPFRATYVLIEVTRSGDTGGSDGGWTIDIQGG